MVFQFAAEFTAENFFNHSGRPCVALTNSPPIKAPTGICQKNVERPEVLVIVLRTAMRLESQG